jgi:hypothetical protein
MKAEEFLHEKGSQFVHRAALPVRASLAESHFLHFLRAFAFPHRAGGLPRLGGAP